MAILSKIQDYKGRKAQDEAAGQSPSLTNVERTPEIAVNEGVSQDAALPAPVSDMRPQGDIASGADINSLRNERIPYQNAQEMHDAVVPRVRSEAIQNMSEEDFRRKAEEGNISEKEYWAEQIKKDPNNTYAILANHFADAETPEEKRKRERREKIENTISGLGNVISNAVNLYYTSQGAVPIDLTTPMKEEDERRRRIQEKRDALKEKQDAILMNAKMGDIKYARQVADAKSKADAARQEKVDQRVMDLMKFNSNLSYKQAKDKAEMELKKEQLEETKRHNKDTETIGRSRVAVAAKQAEEKSSNDKNYDYLPYEGGLIPIAKSKARGLYSQLYQAMKRDPNLNGDEIENIKLQMGEGGDDDSKMMNTVRRRINDSPAAQELLRKYMGMSNQEKKEGSNTPFFAPWGGQVDYSKYKRSKGKTTNDNSSVNSKSKRPLN